MSDKIFKTDQESFWAGEFGSDYIERNTPEKFLASNIALFSKILTRTHGVSSVIELGANIGLNLEAIGSLLPAAKLSAVEINETACSQLCQRVAGVTVQQSSILDMDTSEKFDLALIKGVLIHINPDELTTVYDKLSELTSRYVVIAEYYNPTPIAINYRGHADRLFKRDFAGEFLDRHDNFEVVDYGFAWRKDKLFPQDDLTWFLLRRVCQEVG